MRASGSASLVVALDYPAAEPALALAGKLPAGVWCKVGLELFSVAGPALVEKLASAGKKVFIDLKFFDIPNTVQSAAAAVCRAGAAMFTVHAMGGARMMEAAMAGRKAAGSQALIVGVTVLTSMDAEDMFWSNDVGKTANDLALRAYTAGLDGVVCSGHEVHSVKVQCGQDFLCVTPGIRPAGETAGDQRRVMTPRQAVAAGADFLVVGRPITAAADPGLAAETMLASMIDQQSV